MVDVIVGLNLADAIIASGPKQSTNKTGKFKFNVFKECNVNRSDYYSSLSYYSNQPEELQEIYRAAIDSLNKLRR